MNQFRVSLWVGSPLLKIVPPPIISKSIRPHLYKKYYEKHSSETYTSEHIKLTEPDRLLQVSFEYGLSQKYKNTGNNSDLRYLNLYLFRNEQAPRHVDQFQALFKSRWRDLLNFSFSDFYRQYFTISIPSKTLITFSWLCQFILISLLTPQTTFQNKSDAVRKELKLNESKLSTSGDEGVESV